MVTNETSLIECPGCGAEFPEHDGPVHRYLESTPGCWAAFGEVLAREYSDPTYMKVHHLTADAYPVQHPGTPTRRNTQSVIVHLIGLHAALDLECSQSRIAKLRDGATDRIELEWLEPPENRGTITVADVLSAESAREHARLVREWAEDAWMAWEAHHRQIEAWTAGLIG